MSVRLQVDTNFVKIDLVFDRSLLIDWANLQVPTDKTFDTFASIFSQFGHIIPCSDCEGFPNWIAE